MRMIHREVIREKPASKRPRIRSSPTVSQEYVNPVLQFLQSDTFPESFDRQEIANFKYKVFSFILLLAFVFVFKNYICHNSTHFG